MPPATRDSRFSDRGPGDAGREVDPPLTEPIIRAATYDAAGRVERIRIGEAPPRLDPALLAPGEDRFEYDRAQRSLTL